jgi:hypothetical protein
MVNILLFLYILNRMSLSVPSSGSIDFLTLATVFGLSGPPYDLARLKRDGTFVPNISTNNAISTTNNNLNLLAFRGSTVEQTITLTNSTNVNLYTLFTASYSLPTSRKFVKFIIPSGVTIGATSTGNYALTIGAFPTGTTVVVEISGSVQGAGGAGGTSGVGANGGPAINADVAIATTILIKTGGSVYGGGGGGGKAGAGGAGGKGGNGNYVNTTTETRYNSTNYWNTSERSDGALKSAVGLWDNLNTFYTTNFTATSYGDYTRGTLQTTFTETISDGSRFTRRRYQIKKTTSTTISTTGGNGGGGGAGGNGGRGAGYNQTSTTGSGGSSGSGGAAGGTNSGTGGTGGSGGTGGNGGALGTAGTSGGSGNTGATGTNGNVSNGAGGGGGSSGSGGGSAGTSIYKPGRTNVTVTKESGSTVLPAV